MIAIISGRKKIISTWLRMDFFTSCLPELLRKTYSLFCASFSAQILTLPIMAYYFHSISLNSILINIIAVPVATLLLYGGIILLSLPGFISIYLAYIVSGLTHIFIFSLELFSRIVINLPDLYPTSTHIILVYTIIIFTIIYLITRTRQILKLLCTTVGQKRKQFLNFYDLTLWRAR